jgi:predicted DNA-binding mobile mystery protein A
MREDYREMWREQLAKSLTAFEKAKQEPRPHRGWLRAVREALGLTLQKVAVKAGTSKQHIEKLEKAEADDRISIRGLRRVAEAMDCELVYAIIPKSGTIQELAERPLRSEVTRHMIAAEKSMALENQATGNLEKKIEDELRWRKSGKK